MHVDDEVPAASSWRSSPPVVVAVLVAHRGSRWLPRTLAALTSLEHPPDHLVLVHDGTDAATRDLLEAHPDALVVTAPARSGFGAQVAAGLAAVDAPYDWIWTLHDDQVCAPSSLAALLDAATADPAIAVVGPKVREWPSLRRLLEVGLTVTGTGHRETGLESGEPDAGQHDRARDVLAVGTSGLLVRGDVWRELGGFDPRLTLYFDDIDLGWRVNRAGYRVRTAPEAVVFHAEASRNHRRVRRGGLKERSGEERAAALYTLHANVDTRRLPVTSARLFLGSILRCLAFLAGKDLRAARGELVAIGSVYGHPVRLARARRSRRPAVRRRRREFADLFPSFWLPYQHGLELAATTAQAVVRPEAVESMGLRTLGEDEEDRDPVVVDLPPWWRRWPWLTTVLALTVGALIAARSVLGGTLHSAVMPPAPDQVSAWWGLLFDRTHPVGLGSADWAPAYVVPLAGVSWPAWWWPGLTPWVVTVLAVPLAALTAHRFARLVSDDRGARILWAVGYGLLVVTTGAVTQGRLGTIVAIVVLPAFANLLLRSVLEPTWTRAAGVGLWIAVVAAFAPVAWVLALAALAVCAILVRSSARYVALSAVIGTALLGPWLWQRVWSSRIWWEAGQPVDVNVSAWRVLAGSGGGSAGAPWWIVLPLVVAAVAALVPDATRRAVTAAWIVAVGGLAAGLLASVSTYVPYPGASAVGAWAGVGAGLWVGGLLTAVLFAWPMLRTRRYRRWTRAAVVLFAGFPILAATWWVVRGIDDPLDSGPTEVVPAYLAARSATTVVLTGDSERGIVADAVEGAGPVLGEESMRTTPERERELHDRIESLVTTPTRTDVDALARLGVDAIYAPDVDPELARRIDAASGLVRSGSGSPDSRAWVVESEVSAEPAPQAPSWRPAAVAVWVLAWVATAVAALPVRRRTEEPAEDGEDR